MTKDLWPVDLLDNIPITPKDILEFQATLLGQKTNYVVTGVVEAFSSEDYYGEQAPKDEGIELHARFALQVPRINYSYRLLWIGYPIELYPVKDLDSGDIIARDSTELEEFIKKILQAPKTIRLVKALYAQGRRPNETPNDVQTDEDIPF